MSTTVITAAITAARGIFVTGTDTEIGKTWVSTALVAELRRRGRRVGVMKPVASGAVQTAAGLRNEDALALMAAAAGEPARYPGSYAEVNAYCFAPPISPHLAAAEAGVSIELERLRELARSSAPQFDCQVVEGAGGWRAPLGPTSSMADLAQHLGLPVLLVVGLRLGCLNHAVLSAEAIRQTGLPLAGWVANSIDPAMSRREDNLATLGELLGAPPLAIFPYGDDPDARRAAAGLALDRLAAIGFPLASVR